MDKVKDMVRKKIKREKSMFLIPEGSVPLQYFIRPNHNPMDMRIIVYKKLGMSEF